MTFADRICLISADGIILCATWFNTYAIRARTSDTIADRVNNRTALVTTLLMDGTVYFLALLAVNVLNIVAKATGVSEALGTFITPLSSMIISHFLLNLRQAESQPWGDAVSSQHHAYSSKINFALATLVNDMSEDLSHGAILADPDIDWSRIRDDGDDDLPTGADDSNPPAADLERV
ncbi:hypothetical protein OBBRIDRAFT_431088 [Obba rivulosa]|uniref:Uncharacterized protein n=1 Tax=Obba rivulosa TaxID=1052685 RepID=A0A8E2AHC8_9APHY|nr:hypothetical protein OBBRIDRAFT_431088 [Obba rivulosa]